MAKMGRRQRVETVKGYVAAQEQATTVFLYDTSGSMNGDTAYFVSVYMQSFADRVLSEGPQHQAWLLGFDAAVHTDIRLSTPEQGRDFVMHSPRYTANTHGSTEAIAEAIDTAIAKLRDSDRRATLILVSDCISEIDMDMINEKLRSAKQPVRFALLSVNQGSPKLAALAMEAQDNPDGMRFIHWTNTQIKTIVEATNAENPTPKNPFYSTVSWNSFESRNARLLSELMDSGRDLERVTPSLWQDGHYSTEQALRAYRASRFQTPKPLDDGNRDFMLRHLSDFLRLVGAKYFEAGERRFILDPFFSGWSAWFRAINDLNTGEREHLRRIFEWMNG
jgi:hypothetical protein